MIFQKENIQPINIVKNIRVFNLIDIPKGSKVIQDDVNKILRVIYNDANGKPVEIPILYAKYYHFEQPSPEQWIDEICRLNTGHPSYIEYLTSLTD